MDNAELAGVELAKDEAHTSLANSAATVELAVQAGPGGPLFGLHALVGGRYVIFGGGIRSAATDASWGRDRRERWRSRAGCRVRSAGVAEWERAVAVGAGGSAQR